MSLILLALLVAGDVPAAAPRPEKPKLICRDAEKELGSHMRTNRRCLTAEEWQNEDARRDRIPLTARVSADPDDAARAATRPH
jgi:hypothetical protein